jgi:hypothetical protein
VTEEKPNTTVRLRTHPECAACCSRRACHFCAGTAAGLYMAKHRGHTYFACAAHRRAMEDSIKTDPRESIPNPRAYPVSPLLS